MPISNYLKTLRESVGTALVLVPGAGAVVRDDKGRVLLQRRSDNGRWGLPGGAVDPGEHPAQALVREVFEETGLKVIPGRIAAVVGSSRHTYANGDQAEYTITFFDCQVVGGVLGGLDDETLELRFFAPEEMPDLVTDLPLHVLTCPNRESFFEWDEAWLDALEPTPTEEP